MTSTRRVYFITHPDVVVDPAVPVPRWPLSPGGLERMRRLLSAPWIAELTAVFSSDEQKAIDGARVIAEYRGLVWEELADLGENDRSSTGFLPVAEFQTTADAFFARPEESIRGWECAIDAQRRIVAAVAGAAARAAGDGPVAVVSHGGVGTLLLCHVLGVPISRSREQPGKTGGNYFSFDVPPPRLVHGWTPIDGRTV